MTKQDRQKIIDGGENTAGSNLTAVSYRPVNENTPPVPQGFSVQDAREKVILRVDIEADEAANADIINTLGPYVVSRVREVDSTGQPIGEPTRVAFFNSATETVAREEDDAQLYWYAAQRQSLTGAKFSDYTTWVPGIFLSDSGIADRFDTYGGSAFEINDDDQLGYLQIAEIEEDEGWLSAADDLPDDLVWHTDNTTYVRFGDDALELEVPAAGTTPAWNVYYPFGSTIDFTAEGRFTSDDYVTLKAYREGASASNFDVYIAFYTTKDTDFYSDTFTLTGSSAKSDIVRLKQSDFASTGTPSWSTINGVQLSWGYIPGGTPLPTTDSAFVDDLKLSKADPDDSTLDNVTGGVWKIYPWDATAAVDDYYLSVATDFPGEAFSLGLPRAKINTGQAIAVRPGVEISDGVWAGGVYLHDTDGKAGIMVRAEPPWKTLETPVINVMFDQGDDEAVFQTHTPTSSGLNYGVSNTLGAYTSKQTGDTLSYAGVTLPNSRNEFTIYEAIRADWDSTAAGDKYLFYHYIDANNNIALFYRAADDVWRLTVEIAGSTTTLNSSSQTFSTQQHFTLAAVVDDQSAFLYVDGVLEDQADLGANYSSSSGTLYIGNNNSGGFESLGRYYQIFIDREAYISNDLLAINDAWINNNRLGQKVATVGQHNYYLLSINSTGNTVDLESYRYGHRITETWVLDESFPKTINSDQVYYLGCKCENVDTDNDGNRDQVKLTAWVTTNPALLFTGDSQVFSVTHSDASYPIYSGGVGVWTDHPNARFANIRAGSPQRAEEAERATYARIAAVAEGLTTLTVTPKQMEDGRGNANIGNKTIGTNITTRVYTFDAALDESAVYSFIAPVSGKTVTVDYYWANPTATSNDYRIFAGTLNLSTGSVTTGGSETQLGATEAAPGTVDTLSKTTFTLSHTYKEGDIMVVECGRLGTSGSDTATGNLHMYLVVVTLS